MLTINTSSEASPENERATSNEEVNVSPKLEYEVKPIDASTTLTAPENITSGILAGFCRSL